MEDLILKLTDNYQYATDLILLLEMENDTTSMHYLNYLDIKGKMLDNLRNCMPEVSYEYLWQTIRFLRSNFVIQKDIHANLNSPNPICFITRLLEEGESWENAYENFAGDFYSHFPSNNSKRR